MVSAYTPPWRRFLHRFAGKLLFKKCPDGNFHWKWDRLCYCRLNEHCVSKNPKFCWHGGIYDFKTKEQLFTQEQYDENCGYEIFP